MKSSEEGEGKKLTSGKGLKKRDGAGQRREGVYLGCREGPGICQSACLVSTPNSDLN